MTEEVDCASPKKICGPEEADCTKVCSCSECLVQINKLWDFDKFVGLNLTKVSDCYPELRDAKSRVIAISKSFCWASDLLDFLHTRLEAVDKKLGVWPSLEKTAKIGETDRKTWDAILDCELLFREYKERIAEQTLLEEEEEDDDDNMEERCPWKRGVNGRVNNGLLLVFRNTSVKERARDILEMILKVETTELAHLSPLTLKKKKLELQIQLVNMLPIDRLVCEFNEEMERASNIELSLPKLDEARKLIRSVVLFKLRRFLQKYKYLAENCPPRMHKDNEHGPTRLKGVLESFVHKAELFEKKWDEECAPLITNCGRQHKTSSTQGSQPEDLTTLYSEFLQQ